jgi:large subunit ribosomal protein L10
MTPQTAWPSIAQEDEGSKVGEPPARAGEPRNGRSPSRRSPSAEGFFHACRHLAQSEAVGGQTSPGAGDHRVFRVRGDEDLRRLTVPRPEKVAVVEKVRDELSGNPATLLTEYRGLTVPELAELRNQLREAGARYVIVKNTLARIAAREAGFEELEAMFVGPTALTICEEDPVGPAKALRKFAKDHPELVVKGGILDGRIVDKETAEKLADLESREELLSKLAGMMYAMLANTASLFQAPIAQMARLIAALEEKGEAPAGEAPAETDEAPAAADKPAEPEATADEPEAEAEADEAEAETGESEGSEPETAEAGQAEAPADDDEAEVEEADASAEAESAESEEAAAEDESAEEDTEADEPEAEADDDKSVAAAGVAGAVETVTETAASVVESAGSAVAGAVETTAETAGDVIETAGETVASAAEAVTGDDETEEDESEEDKS